jgi:hypothetical protein
MKTFFGYSLNNEHSLILFISNQYFKALRLALPLLVLITTSASSQSALGPFVQEMGRTNPFNPPITFPSIPAPVLADIDRDGDKDLVVGTLTSDSGYGIRYYENEGTATTPLYVERLNWDNPFYYVVFESPTLTNIRPSFGDFDKDGDLDLVTGSMQQGLRYYKNVTNWLAENPVIDYEKQTTAWNSATGVGNPFTGINFFYSAPYVVDIDHDNDDDLVLGTLADDADGNYTIHLYTNDGTGSFSHSHLAGVNPTGLRISPSVVDFDYDQDFDIITGDQDGVLRYFENAGNNTFAEVAGWSVFTSFNLGTYVIPAFADLTNDGLLEAVVGSSPTSSPQTIAYLLNKGANTFEKKTGIYDPFGGVWIYYDATPYFADVDYDGDDDVLFDNRRDEIIYMKNNNGVFDYAPAEENSFASIVTANEFCISYVDLNNDGKKDIVGGSSVGIQYFQATSGTFTPISVESGPFKDITTFDSPKTDFVDIDADGDLDLFLSDAVDATRARYRIRYFKNTGTPEAPVFVEQAGSSNLLSSIQEEYELYPRFVDIDHDGDLDALIGEGGDVHAEITDSNEFLFFENTGNATTPNFVYRGDLIPQFDNGEYFSPAFTDIDHDGDLDVFEGDSQGRVWFYRNNNASPVTSVNATTLSTNLSAGTILVDDNLSIVDADNDEITRVLVAISNFNSNDSLSFIVPEITPQPEINYSFNDDSGELTISGRAAVAFYQQLLRSLNYHFDEGSGNSSGRSATVSSATKNISIRVYDTDLTTPAAAIRTVAIAAGPNSAPEIANATLSINAGAAGTIDLTPLLSDVDNNLDVNTLTILTAANSAASTSLSTTNLNVDYTAMPFAGTDEVTLRVCDDQGLCADGTITINVLNTPPVFPNTTRSVNSGANISLSLATLISDAENNVVLSTLEITNSLASGASASIAEGQLTIDYTGITFSGTESLQLQVCDIANACAGSTFTIEVINQTPEESIIVYNAVAPKGSSELNRYLHIANLPENNSVTVFNRWGDEVYHMNGYSNETSSRRFEGSNKNGNALPSGTYFYKIEYQRTSGSGAKQSDVLTGYLSLQQ